MTLRRRRRPAAGSPFKASYRRAALLDAAHDAYADWVEESSAVTHLYVRWSAARRHERRLAFAAYAAALEREERAAQVYADMIDMATTELRAS